MKRIENEYVVKISAVDDDNLQLKTKLKKL